MATAESEVEALRSEVARFHHTSNPLPRPPEPIPLDRFPSSVNAVWEAYHSSRKTSRRSHHEMYSKSGDQLQDDRHGGSYISEYQRDSHLRHSRSARFGSQTTQV